MSDLQVTVGRGVIAEVVASAALEVPGVLRLGRGGSWLRRTLGGRPVIIRLDGRRVSVRLWIVARPGQSIAQLVEQVTATVTATVQRRLDLEPADITILVDGVGG